jgi:hypothetical protein
MKVAPGDESPPVSLSERERELALALALTTFKLYQEWMRREAARPRGERLHWPDCWAEAQRGWRALEDQGLVPPGKKPYFTSNMFDRLDVAELRRRADNQQLVANGWERVGKSWRHPDEPNNLYSTAAARRRQRS